MSDCSNFSSTKIHLYGENLDEQILAYICCYYWLFGKFNGHELTDSGEEFSVQWKKSYLQDRNPLPYASNYTLILDQDYLLEQNSGSDFFDQLGYIILKLLPSDEEAPPTQHKFCKEQMGHLYNTRLPGETEDTVIDTSHSDYVAVISADGVYKLKGIKEVLPLSAHSIGQTLRSLKPCSNPVTPAVTHLKRSAAAQQREHLKFNCTEIAECIQVLDHALFIVILDPSLIQNSSSQLFETMQLGQGKNRWFDKSIQVIAIGEEHIGLNIAHSHFDGMAIVRKLTQEDQQQVLSHKQPSLEGPWHISCTDLTAISSDAEASSTYPQCNFSHEKFTHQNLLEVSKKLKNNRAKLFSLDAVFQVALVAAQYQVFGSRFPLNTYESVDMSSRFHHGRTECARGVTEEAIAYAKAPDQDLLIAALLAHKRQIISLQDNEGFERTLYMAQAHMDAASFSAEYSDVHDCLQWINKSPISTSNLSHPMFKHFVFCPTTDDGFGIGYSAPSVSNTIHFTLSCFSTHKAEADLLKDQLKSQLSNVLMLLGTDIEAAKFPEIVESTNVP